MGLLPYTVETFDGSRHRHLGDFRRLKPACAAARRALLAPRVTLVVVKDREGRMVYACDGSREWEGGEAIALTD